MIVITCFIGQKRKRLLTEHQKEVMRSKKRSSMPAMYNDLSQNSLTTDSLDSQSIDNVMPVVVSYSSISKDEDALLEPPSPITNSFPASAIEDLNTRSIPVKQSESLTVGKLIDIFSLDIDIFYMMLLDPQHFPSIL